MKARDRFHLVSTLAIISVLYLATLGQEEMSTTGGNHTSYHSNKTSSSGGWAREDMQTFREFLLKQDAADMINSTSFKEIQEIIMDEARYVLLPDGDAISTQEIRLAILRLGLTRILKRLLARGKSRGVFPKPSDVSTACYDDVMEFIDGLIGVPGNDFISTRWALQMLDAYGKPSAGMLMGVLHWVGNYEECLDTRAPPSPRIYENSTRSRQVEGKYCRVLIPIGHIVKMILPVDVNKFWHGQNNVPQAVNWGVCVPHTCSQTDIVSFLTNGTLGALNIPVANATCFEGPDFRDDPAAVVTVTFLCVVVAIVVGCTVIDVYETHKPWFGTEAITQYGNGYTGRRQSIELHHTADVTIDMSAPDPPQEEANQQSDQIPCQEKTSATLGDQTTKNSNSNLANGQNHVNHGYSTDENDHQSPDTRHSVKEESGSPKYEGNGEIPAQLTEEITTVREEPQANDVRGSATGQQGQNKKSTGRQMIQSVSLYRNLQTLLSTQRSKATFDSIQGIRVISMAWIVVGHCYTYGGILDETNLMFKNTVELVNTSARLSFHIVGSAHLAVDSFFMISGCLVMRFTLKQLERRRRNPAFWLLFYFHRFWRLTPMYMTVLMVGTNLYQHAVQGPLKADQLEEFHQCRRKWWAHLLYINNFYKPHLKCMTWSWFMAVDMQVYIISPIFIYAVYRNLKVGVSLILCLLVVGMASGFASEYIHGGQFVLMDMSFLDYWSYVYTMPWARVGAFAVGLLLGVILYNHPNHPIMSKQKAACIWLLAISVAVFLVLINHQQWKNGSQHWSNVAQGFYEALVRPVWALCVAWAVYACCTGLGGCVNSILGWEPFIVLSRLAYSVYLLHPLVIMFVVYSRRTPIYLHPNHLSVAYNYIGNLTMTYLLAVVFYLVFEVPFTALEKMLLPSH